MQCLWCDTKHAAEYIRFRNNETMICTRCLLIATSGATSGHGLPVPHDSDPNVIAFQERLSESFTLEDYLEWVYSYGTTAKVNDKEAFQSFMISKIIDNFLKAHQFKIELGDCGESICCDLDLLIHCATLFPPSSIPRAAMEWADVDLLESFGISPYTIVIKVAEAIFGGPLDLSSLKFHTEIEHEEEQHQVCLNCQGTDGISKACPRCRKPLYCSRKCQKSHWKKHKKECSGPDKALTAV